MLAATILGSSLAFIDSTVVNVAVPALQSALEATLAEVQWVVEAYALTLAALLPTGGSLGDVLGRRKVFAGGVVIFAAASAWCGVSRTIGELIAARALQGIGAALLVPGSLALISASFPAKERGRTPSPRTAPASLRESTMRSRVSRGCSRLPFWVWCFTRASIGRSIENSRRESAACRSRRNRRAAAQSGRGENDRCQGA